MVPVVDDFQRLRGLVTSDDVMDIMEEEATEDMQRMIGLSGEESTATPWGIGAKTAALALCEFADCLYGGRGGRGV